MTVWWIALALAVGILIGFIVASVAAAAGAASQREEYEADLASLQRRGKLTLYDQDAPDPEVAGDALMFSQRMVNELAQEVGALRSVCYETVAWLEGNGGSAEERLEQHVAARRIRAVLEDIEAIEEAR